MTDTWRGFFIDGPMHGVEMEVEPTKHFFCKTLKPGQLNQWHADDKLLQVLTHKYTNTPLAYPDIDDAEWMQGGTREGRHLYVYEGSRDG